MEALATAASDGVPELMAALERLPTLYGAWIAQRRGAVIYAGLLHQHG